MQGWQGSEMTRRKVKRKCQLTSAMMKEIAEDILVAKLLWKDVASKHGVKLSLVSYLACKIRKDPNAFLATEFKELKRKRDTALVIDAARHLQEKEGGVWSKGQVKKTVEQWV